MSEKLRHGIEHAKSLDQDFASLVESFGKVDMPSIQLKKISHGFALFCPNFDAFNVSELKAMRDFFKKHGLHVDEDLYSLGWWYLSSKKTEIPQEQIAELFNLKEKANGHIVEEIPEQQNTSKFEYNREIAKKYGMVELEIPECHDVQAIINKIIAHDPAYVHTDTYGRLTLQQIDHIIDVWNAHPDLPHWDKTDVTLSQPHYSYMECLMNGTLVDTIDDDRLDISKKQTPHFDKNEFLLTMDFPEFNATGRDPSRFSAFGHPSMRLFSTLMPDSPKGQYYSRKEIDEALWQDVDNRIPTKKAREIMAELLGKTQDDDELDEYEFRLMRYDEYMRVAPKKHYRKKHMWTHIDGYVYAREVVIPGFIPVVGGIRQGIYVGHVPNGDDNIADIFAIKRFQSMNINTRVRLVLARK